MKKILTSVALATMVSGSVFAACSAAIDMNTNKIENLVMSESGYNTLTGNAGDNDAATKAYVDAAAGKTYLTLSEEQVNADLITAVSNCAKMVEDGSSIGTDVVKIWRLPTINELMYAGIGNTTSKNLWTVTMSGYNGTDNRGNLYLNLANLRAAATNENASYAYRCVK
jgi:asparagine N-glycosylation enzyme membrane subunit Stt3